MYLSAGVMAEEWMREPAGLDGVPPMYGILKGEVRFKNPNVTLDHKNSHRCPFFIEMYRCISIN